MSHLIRLARLGTAIALVAAPLYVSAVPAFAQAPAGAGAPTTAPAAPTTAPAAPGGGRGPAMAPPAARPTAPPVGMDRGSNRGPDRSMDSARPNRPSMSGETTRPSQRFGTRSAGPRGYDRPYRAYRYGARPYRPTFAVQCVVRKRLVRTAFGPRWVNRRICFR